MSHTDAGIIYHYTSNAALIEIVNSSKLRASDAEYLNDAQEMKYGRAQLELELEALAERLGGKNEARASYMRAASKSLTNRMRMFSATESYATFVACFCSSGDLLSQWRGYGADGGVAIGFDRDALLSAWHGELSAQLVQVEYGPTAVDPMLDWVREKFGVSAREDDISNEEYEDDPYSHASADGYFATAHQLFPLLAKIKHEAFEEEREWRLLVVAKTKYEKYRAGKYGLVPYIDLDFATSAIFEVVVGPGANPELRMQGVERLMGNSKSMSVKVRSSGAPFRG